MKVSPLGAPLDAPQMPAPAGVQRIKMSTKSTPLNYEVPPETPEKPELSINSDPNSTTNAAEVPKTLSPQEILLAKERRALQLKAKELADKEKAISEKPEAPDVLAQLKANPLGMLLDAGVTYDELTQAILANQTGITPEVRALQAKVKDLETGLDKKLVDRDTQAEQQVLAEMRKEALKLASDGDTYELVRETGSIPQVMQLIERTYREQGEVLDVSEAMQLIEDELIKDSLRIAKTKKVQSGLAPTLPPPQQSQPKGSRTLTNRDTARAVVDRKARAIAAFHGQLKK